MTANDTIEDGFVCMPLSADEKNASVRLCVLIRREPDPASGHLVLLRRFQLGRVLLGCLTDHRGRVSEWVELWFQCPPEGTTSWAETNAGRDRDWDRLAEALRTTDLDAHFTREVAMLEVGAVIKAGSQQHANRIRLPTR